MLKKFRVRNTTKNQWFYVWSKTVPTEDPNYPTDSIDEDSTAILEIEDVTKAFIQVNVSVGTDLSVTNLELPLTSGSAMQAGTGFVVHSNNIIIEDPGTYEVDYSVCGQMAGNSTSNRRRSLQVELNKNTGTIIQATRAGGYTRTVTTGNTCHAGGSYTIVTVSDNETIGLKTKDTSKQSTAGITFTAQGGYLRVRRVE